MHVDSKGDLLLLRSACRPLLPFVVHQSIGKVVEDSEDRLRENWFYVNISLRFILPIPDSAAGKLVAFCVVPSSDNYASLLKLRVSCFTGPFFVEEGFKSLFEVLLVEREIGFRSTFRTVSSRQLSLEVVMATSHESRVTVTRRSYMFD